MKSAVRCSSKTIKRANPGRNYIVELHQDDEHDAQVRADDAKQRAKSIERLCDDDAAFDCGAHFSGGIVFQKPCAHRIPPTGEEHSAEKENIEPVHNKSSAIVAELG